MKQSTSILRGLNDIRAAYILESEIPDSAPSFAAPAEKQTARDTWRRVTSSGWFVAAVCAVVAFGTLAGIIRAGQQGSGTVNPAGTLPESTVETERVEEITLEPTPTALRGLKREITYNADGTEDSRTTYTYENGLLVQERYYIDGRGFAMKEYTYNENGLVIQEKYTFDEVASAGWTTTYEYDGQGRVIILRQDVYDSDKPVEEVRTEYDEFGRVAKEESAEWVTIYTYGENDSFVSLQVYKNEDTVVKGEQILDKNGNVTRIRHHRNDKITVDLAYEYNEEGRRIQCIEYQSDGSVSSLDTYEYEGENLVLNSTFIDGKLTSTFSYEYNEYGECVREEFRYMDNTEWILSSVIEYEYGHIN